MERKEDGEVHEDRPSSPIWVLQHLSEEAFRVAGEALHSVYSGNSNVPPLGPGHRRAQSEVLTMGHRRSNSFHRLKSHVQKAWKWGSNLREEGRRSSFNPEVLANQKRQWYQLHSKVLVFYIPSFFLYFGISSCFLLLLFFLFLNPYTPTAMGLNRTRGAASPSRQMTGDLVFFYMVL